jgi:hypothetical protein
MINIQYSRRCLIVNRTRKTKAGDTLVINQNGGSVTIRKVKVPEDWNGHTWSKTSKRVYYPLLFMIQF